MTLVDESGIFLCQHHYSTVVLHGRISSAHEQYARWWLQFRDVVSPYQHNHHHHHHHHQDLLGVHLSIRRESLLTLKVQAHPNNI
jgi:hypothetical protein